MPDENNPTPASLPNKPAPGGSSLTPAERNLAADADYAALVVKYQNAEWADCERILADLLEKYPESKWLVEFKRDLDVQKVLKRIGIQDKKKRRQQIALTVLFNFLFLIVVVVVGYFLVTQILKSYQEVEKRNLEAAQQIQLESLRTMEDQAWALLQAGKPEMALELADKIESIDPNYTNLEQMRSQANDQIALIEVYDQAVQLMEAKDYAAAQPLLEDIHTKSPFYRDVKARMETIDQYYYVRDLVTFAEEAYKAKDWAGVIKNYEEALQLDPTVDSEAVKQQLLTSYLRSVLETLREDSPTIEEIQLAEKFYQKAVALVPQSKTYSAEREQLQLLSVQLLVTKYYQVAKGILVDPTHNEKMVTGAVDYLNRALSLSPNDPELNSEVGKAQIYLAALRNFNAGKWEQAIEQLTALSNFDPNYPNGLGVQMLYEAYRARGERYYYGGFYLDARKNFEAAEVLAYADPEKKLRLLEIQINVGNTLGKLDDYENACSYYKYAFEMVDALKIGAKDEALVAELQEAAGLFEQEKYFEAYNSYKAAIEKIPSLYSYQSIGVIGGESLVYLASTYNSTIQAIQIKNDLKDGQNLLFVPTLDIPYIP